MTAAASASRSAVVMPGRTASRTVSSARATTRPALRIDRTWSCVLYSMRSRPNIVLLPGGPCGTTVAGSADESGQRRDDAPGDLVDVADAVDADQQPALVVGGRERRRLLGVDVETARDRLLGVVLAALDLGTLREAREELVTVRGELDDAVQRDAEVGEDRVELDDLGRVARVAVEDEPLRGVVLREAVAHHRVGHRVRDELALRGVLLREPTELRAALDVRPEDVAGRDRGDGQLLGEPGGLRALARALGAHHDETGGARRGLAVGGVAQRRTPSQGRCCGWEL